MCARLTDGAGLLLLHHSCVSDLVEVLVESGCSLVSKLGRSLKDDMEGVTRRGMTVGHAHGIPTLTINAPASQKI